MTRMYIKEIYYCTLHLRKNYQAITGKSVTVEIMRNSDNYYLDLTNSTWVENTSSDTDINLTETSQGIYQYSLDISTYNNVPDSYTIIYKYFDEDSNRTLVSSEQVLFERKNKSRLV